MKGAQLDRRKVPQAGPLRPFDFPPIEHFELSSGIPVAFAQTTGLPVVTVSLLLQAGALQEAPARAGLATLTGNLLESGTARLDGAAVAEELESMGARLSVGSGWEVAFADVTVLPERAEEAARLVAELVRVPSFPEAEVERIRGEQLAGIAQRRADPRALANEMISRFIFDSESPFSRPLSGNHGSVASLAREDVVGFHRAGYTPRGATLVVAGNLPAEEARRIGEGAFGGWEGEPTPAAAARAEARSNEREIIVVERPGAVQSEIRVGHLGVARSTPDYFPILVMNAVLGGSFSSRLNMNLREKNGFTYGVRSSFTMRRSSGSFLVSTAVQTEVTGDAVREIVRELAGMRDERVTPAELDDARQYVAGTFPLRLQTTDGVASRLAELAIYGLPDSYVQEFPSSVLEVSADDVATAARERVHPERLAIVIVGDAEKLRPQLEALDLGPVRVVPPASE